MATSTPDSTRLGSPSGSALGRSLEAMVVLVKVTVFCAAWLAVFLLTFLGYLTLPAIVLFSFLIIYSLADLLGRRVRR